jgi:hypothetical protein
LDLYGHFNIVSQNCEILLDTMNCPRYGVSNIASPQSRALCAAKPSLAFEKQAASGGKGSAAERP